MFAFKKRANYNEAALLHRRQFVLGPSYVENFPSWKRISIGDSLCITAHPELNTHQSVQGNKSITLLGYILDAERPEYDDSSILEHLLTRLAAADGFSGVLRGSETLGGRWILIIDDGQTIRLFSDPMGLRQVHYTNHLHSGAMWCSTQPGLMADVLKLRVDEAAKTGYVDTPVYAKWTERLWPGDSSPYKEISHLLPNHYLDLGKRECRRFWPNRDLPRLSVEEAALIGSKILAALVNGAARRFELGMALSAGWDSRVLLAASRECCKRMFFYTYAHGSDSPDAIIARRLLRKLGFKCHLIRYPKKMDAAFERIYNRNVAVPHEYWGRTSQALYQKYPGNRVCITGNAAEITRVRFRLSAAEKLTGRNLARFMSFEYAKEMQENSFVVDAWEKWIQDLNNTYNVHPLDIFYWEHWGGNFAAMDQNEWEIVHETLTPFNCRKYLQTMLSIDETYREHDDPIHYRLMIRNLWPEVLTLPVNPAVSSLHVFPKWTRVTRVARRVVVGIVGRRNV
jgi:hypothetical protein